MVLSLKHLKFVTEYLVDLNATEAAIRAGYSPHTARSQGARLLTDADIQAAIARKQDAQLERTDLTATRVLEELRRLSFSNVQDLFDEVGNFRPIQTLTREQAACIASLEVIKKNAVAGDGMIDTIHKVKVWDKTRSLEMVAKHFKLLTDVVKIEDAHALEGRLTAARNRLAKAKGDR
jgi:phage terminase small subunit